MIFKKHTIAIPDLEQVWQNAASCLEDLEGAKIFITGATGFFGIWILESLRFAVESLGLNLQVWILTRSKENFFLKAPYFREATWLHILEGDIRSFAFPKLELTHFIHGATEASAALNIENPLLMADTVVEGTKNSLEFAKKSGVKKYLFISSGAVYGEQPTDLEYINENYTGAPNPLSDDSAYGMSKRFAENLCYLYAKNYGLELKIARCFAFVGPYLPQNTHFAIGNFINNLVTKKPIAIFGDGSPLRSYLYASDLVIWLIKILCEGESYKAYNVGSENYVSIEDLALLISKISDTTVPVEIAKNKNPHVLLKRYVPSTKFAEQSLGLKVLIDLPTAVLKTLEWSLANA